MHIGRFRVKVFSRKGAIRLACLFLFILLATAIGGAWMISMPGESHAGPLPPLTAEEGALAASLRRDVEELAGSIGNRNHKAHSRLMAAADFMERRLRESGHEVRRQTFELEGLPFHNLEVEISGTGRSREIVVVGAHYDSAPACPAANDNGSGSAALLSLAASFAGKRPARTLRFVAFTNEEPPFFNAEGMGSRVYARRCRERNEDVTAMVSLETLGYYSDEEGSQKYPPPLSRFYPSRGNFVAFVGNVSSRSQVRSMIACFRREVKFPSEGAALPAAIQGVGWSDHLSFWQEGYPGVMVTDTAVFRYPWYHTRKDTPEKLDYERLARVVSGLRPVIAALAE